MKGGEVAHFINSNPFYELFSICSQATAKVNFQKQLIHPSFNLVISEGWG